jgi:hypothetical protein
VRDIEVINTELVLADLETVKKRLDKVAKDAKRGDKVALAEEAVLKKFEPVLNEGKLALSVKLTPEEKVISKAFFLLTDKPTIFACNVKEGELAQGDKNPYVQKVQEYVKTHLACEAVVISAQIESDLIDLTPEEAKAFLKELGVDRKRHRRVDPRDVSSARLADLFHGGRKRSARVDDSRGRHRAESGGRHSLGLRARLHQSRNRGLRRLDQVRLGCCRARKRFVPHGRQGIRRERRRRAALQIQRVGSAISSAV